MEWVGEIRISPTVEAKLRTEHGLMATQVREAVSFRGHEQGRWSDHPKHGRRLLVMGRSADGVELVAVLRPLDREDGLWQCLTAWKMDVWTRSWMRRSSKRSN